MLPQCLENAIETEIFDWMPANAFSSTAVLARKVGILYPGMQIAEVSKREK